MILRKAKVDWVFRLVVVGICAVCAVAHIIIITTSASHLYIDSKQLTFWLVAVVLIAHLTMNLYVRRDDYIVIDKYGVGFLRHSDILFKKVSVKVSWDNIDFCMFYMRRFWSKGGSSEVLFFVLKTIDGAHIYEFPADDLGIDTRRKRAIYYDGQHRVIFYPHREEERHVLFTSASLMYNGVTTIFLFAYVLIVLNFVRQQFMN